MPRPAIVTSALPYGNGHLHIGHLVGYIHADIWVRARRLAGGTVHFVCANDTHGTPIMLAAEKAGVAPEEFIKVPRPAGSATSPTSRRLRLYHSTHSPENRELTERFYRARRGRQPHRTPLDQQLYDPVKAMFLPDHTSRASAALQRPTSTATTAILRRDLFAHRTEGTALGGLGATPELGSEHFFFKVGDFTAVLRDWLEGEVAVPGVKAKLREWIDAEGSLRDWDISATRPTSTSDPGHPGKYFYVWLTRRSATSQPARAGPQRPQDRLRQAAFGSCCGPARAELPLHRQDIVFHGLFCRRCYTATACACPTGCTSTAPDGGRGQDEQVARHLRDGAHLPRQRPRPRGCATASRPSLGASTTST